ncbi:MAG: tRNA (adenosine(37)-N6)-threonylcarbamoyltransferase complex transferase subunit TsaD [Cytophagaceae bacterium]|jgi:N6-L-threonylcarbamoyladenine synthase|nr:tRNA (adenosine(37)-N6)-threonylcarbamoyltransferase complex transferase subunit TsaD [Cytophagaceae bacterium]
MSVILAIESSCDDTSAAILYNGKLRSHVVASQKVHELYGGVVPELASRAHQQHIVPVVHQAIQQANITKKEIQAVAFTKGPGLLGSLLVGVSFAKSLSLAWNVPLIEVDHMKAHILAHFLDPQPPGFPFICLTVSGGHTQLVQVNAADDMLVLGQTQDDAVGEAFDKTAKMLGLPYPGGPMIDQWASKGNPLAFKFPSTEAPGLNFSFSGIKTAFLYFMRKRTMEDPSFQENNMADICASMQHTLIGMLTEKLHLAVKQTGITRIAIAGGVSANKGLRKALQELSDKHAWQLHIPAFEYCTDNAAMIAMAASFKLEAGVFADQFVTPDPRLEF